MTDIPVPPDGYHKPYEYTEVDGFRDMVETTTGRRIMLIQVLLVGGVLVSVPTNEGLIQDLANVVERVGWPTALVGVAVVWILTVVVHENIHRVADEAFGYDAKIEYGFPRSIAWMEDQWIKREHNIVSLVAPLLVISTVAYILGATSTDPVIVGGFGFIFIFNTVDSGGDVHAVLFLLARPRGTLSWMTDTEDGPRSFIYEPE